ncbi:helix-turn-helix domain-containing protein, partial [Actinocorallia lasiicapitis]
AATALADQILAPLDATLRASLRAYLAANGQGDPAARALGVHRHTLRHRMKRVAELLNRDLDAPATRAELWIVFSLSSE